MIIDDKDIAKKSYFNKIATSRHFPNGLLSEIILTIADRCNRKCRYCPYGNGYVSPHTITDISMPVVHKICSDVGVSYDGYFSLSGFGEPTLTNCLIDVILMINDRCPLAKILIHTNGDRPDILDKIPYLSQLVIYISKHDVSLNADHYQQLMSSRNIVVIRNIMSNDVKYFNNRASNVSLPNVDVSQLPLTSCCNIPFYKMSIDVNGDVLQCCSDWKRENIIGNVMHSNIYDVWNNENYKNLRTQLLSHNRRHLLCAKCSALGTLTGNEHVLQWKKLYKMV